MAEFLKDRNWIFQIAIGILSAPMLLAGGPLIVDESSRIPYTWQVPAGGFPAAFYNIETGRLNGSINNATARVLVADAFAAWQGVSSAAITYSDQGTLQDCQNAPLPNCSPGGGIDINENNFLSVFGVPDGQSPIIFDDTGAIFSFLGFPPGVLAFALPEIVTDGAPFAIVEGVAVMNGPALGGDIEFVKGVFVHEFGHFSNLAHSVVNGQGVFFGDASGPSPFDPLSFGLPPIDSIETMYPFVDPATGLAIQTPHADDIASISTLYPDAGFPDSSGSITGTIFRTDAINGITGVNTIVRNILDPFNQAVSAISGDFSQGAGPLGTNDGVYTINGLQSGDYLVYIDNLIQGGFSTTPAEPFVEECYNAGQESADPLVDDPSSCPVVSVASVTSGVDIVLQALPPDPNEPNDTPATATPASCGSTLNNLTIDPVGDLDFYAVPLLEGEILKVNVDAAVLGSTLDSVIGIFATDGTTLLKSNDDQNASTTDSFLTFSAPADGTYYLAVSAWDDFDFDGESDLGFFELSKGFYNLILNCVPPPPPFQLETGVVEVGDAWTTVTLSKVFEEPVVVAKPPSFNDSEESVVRIRNVTSNSFEIRIQEWDFLDGQHEPETLFYLVLERGHYTLPDGTQLQSGKLETSRTGTGGFFAVPYDLPFAAPPVVLSSITTFNGAQAVSTRLKMVNAFQFQLTMQEEGANDQIHLTEEISYVAWQRGSGTVQGTISGSNAETSLSFRADRLSVTDAFSPIDGSPFEVKLEEERSADEEVEHQAETVGFLLLGPYGSSLLLADIQTTAGKDPVALRWRPSPVTMETGQISVNQNWKKINLSESYSNPVVILGPAGLRGATPGTLRIRNVTSNSFELRFQEWPYQDGIHPPETTAYMVVEAGSWSLPNGDRLEAGFFNTSNTGTESFLDIVFSVPFEEQPLVLSSINSFNGSATAVPRVNNVTSAGFEFTMQEAESADQVHFSERIGFVALPAGEGLMAGHEYLAASETVTDQFLTLPGSRVAVHISEEASVDPEVVHAEETLAYLFMDNANLFWGDTQTVNEADPFSLRWKQAQVQLEQGLVGVTSVNQFWRTVPLSRSFQTPVVVARPASSKGPQPGVIRIRNVTANSFEMRFQEWLYLDGKHPLEDVYFLVMEAGRFTLESGQAVEAGFLDTDQVGFPSFVGVNFSTAFPVRPVVLTSTNTFIGTQTVTTRVQDVTAGGFSISMQEEEGNDQNHVEERLAFVAIEPGTGSSLDQIFQVSLASSGSVFSPITFSPNFELTPCFLADMQTTDGIDPANLRYRNLSVTDVEVQTDEETSSDSETGHLIEEVGYLVVSCAPEGLGELPESTTEPEIEGGNSGSSRDRAPSNDSGPRVRPAAGSLAHLTSSESLAADSVSEVLIVPSLTGSKHPLLRDVFSSAVLVNPEPSEGRTTLRAFDEVGRQQDQWTTDLLAGSQRSLSFQSPATPESWSTVRLERGAGSRLEAVVIMADPDLQRLSALPLDAGVGRRLYFPGVSGSNTQTTFLFLSNPQGHEASVTVSYYSAVGQLEAQVEHEMASTGSLVLGLDQMLGDASAQEGFLVVEASAPIQGLALTTSSGDLDLMAGMTGLRTNAELLSHFLVSPQGHETEVRLLNIAADNIQAELEVFVDGQEMSSSVAIDMPESALWVGNLDQILDGVSSPTSGYLRIRSDRSSDLLAMATIHGKDQRGQTSLSSQSARREQLVPFLRHAPEQGLVTGLIVLNPGEEKAEVELQVFDVSGMKLAETVLDLDGSSRKVGSLSSQQFFPDLLLPETGYVKVSSDRPILATVILTSASTQDMMAIPGQ